MKRHVYRRRRTMSFRMIACVHHRREAAGDGRARTAILVAQAIAGCVSGGMGTGRTDVAGSDKPTKSMKVAV